MVTTDTTLPRIGFLIDRKMGPRYTDDTMVLAAYFKDGSSAQFAAEGLDCHIEDGVMVISVPGGVHLIPLHQILYVRYTELPPLPQEDPSHPDAPRPGDPSISKGARPS